MPDSEVTLAPTAMSLHEETPYRWRIDPNGAMRVPGILFASRALLPAVRGDRSLEQVANVATLPGIVTASYAMPDVHWGYGFPIGGSPRRMSTPAGSSPRVASASISPAACGCSSRR